MILRLGCIGFGTVLIKTYPRDIAVRVLTRVLSQNEPLDLALAAITGQESAQKSLEMRAWLQEICSGTLRWKGRLDFILDSTALKKKPTGWLRKALLIATYQILNQERIQAKKIVFETVEQIKRKEGDAPARFANALLRKVVDHLHQWRNQPILGAQLASLPEWLWSRLLDQYGQDWAKTYALASLERPRLWAYARREDWKPDWADPGPIPRSWLAKVNPAVSKGPIFEKSGFKEGEFIVQDISNQILTHEILTLVKEVFPEPRQIQALDLCAAPGGKSIGMAWRGLKVLAADRDPQRLELLKQTLSRISADIKIISRDEVASLPQQDLVWVDAPCTGTGILRRHPEVRWLRKESDLSGLVKVQENLIREAWEKVLPGGFLAYSVCSILKEEGQGPFERATLNSQRVVKEWLLLPHLAPGGDGFWACLIQKEK